MAAACATRHAPTSRRSSRSAPGPAARLALVREVDIATDESLERRNLDRIPVLIVGDEELPLATSVRAMRTFLERTLDGRLA